MSGDGGRGALKARERDRLHDQTRRFLIHALAALEDGELPVALLDTGRALHAIAELDTNRHAYRRVMELLEARRG